MKYSSIIYHIIIFMSCVLCSLAVTYICYNKLYRPSPNIVTLDISTISKEFVVKTAKSDVGKEKAKENIEKFATNLDQLIRKISEDNNLIILPRQAVLGGTDDITRQVEQILGQNDEKK